MKKKVAIVVISLVVLAVVASIGYLLTNDKDNGKDSKHDKKIKVVTTIYPQYDFVREIAGDKADVKMLLKPGAESHSYEPSPQDIKDIENCDVFIYVGGDSDVWVDRILKTIDNKDMKVISLMDCVDTVEEEMVDGMQEHHHDGDAEEHEHHHDGDDEKSEEYYDLPKENEHHDGDAEDHEHHDGDAEEHEHHDGDAEEQEHHHDGEVEYDEHVWTSPANAIKIVEKITNALIDIDKENKGSYESNSKQYIEELKKLDKEFMEVVKNGNKKTLIFGDRFPFRYFVDRYGLDYYAAFPGCSSDTEASASTISFLVDKVRDEKIGVILKLELSKGNIANSIKNDTDAKIMVFHSAHNISDEDFNNKVTYLDIMKNNLKVLEEALK